METDAGAASDKQLRHRAAQERYRQRQKLVEGACARSLKDAEEDLAQWKALAADKAKVLAGLRDWIATLSTKLNAVRAQLSSLTYAPAYTTSSHEPHTGPSGSPNPSIHGSDSASATSQFPELNQGPVPRWFREGPGYVRRPFRHDVHVCVSNAVGAERAVLANLVAFRTAKAAQLRCAVEHVCWLFKSERYSAMTLEDGISSHFAKPGCWARFTCMYYCVVVEWMCLLALSKRLDAARRNVSRSAVFISSADRLSLDATGTLRPAPTPPTASSAASSCTALPAESGATSKADGNVDASAVQPVEAEVEMVAENLRWQLVLDPNAPDGAALQPRHAGGLRARIETAMRHVLRSILRRHLSQMGASDAHRVLKHIKGGVGLRAALALDPEAELTTANAYAVGGHVLLQELHAAAADVRTRSHNPSLPHTAEEIDKALGSVNEGLNGVRREFQLLCFLSLLDNPRLIRGLGQQMRTASVSYAKFEESTLEVYKLLGLSHEQKVAMASALSAFRKQAVAADAKRVKLVQDLDAVLSTTRQHVHHVTTHLHRVPPTPLKSRSHHGGPCTLDEAGLDGLQLLLKPRDPGNLAERLLAWQRLPHALPSTEQLGVLRVLPDILACEQRLLLGLRQLEVRKNELLLQFECLLWSTLLTPRQLATLLTALLPFVPDKHRLCGMAATDVCSARVFGRRAICAAYNAAA